MISASLSPNDILVRAMETPNPLAIKFVTNVAVNNSGKATFQSPIEAESLPFVLSLFNVLGVKQVYLFENTVTITHSGELSHDVIVDQITSVMKTRLPIHDADFSLNFTAGSNSKGKNLTPEDRSHKSPEIQEIEEILDRTVRPGLQADGGDLDVINFEDNEVKILYQGACGGCPSAMMGTLDAIQNILRYELKNDKIIVVPI